MRDIAYALGVIGQLMLLIVLVTLYAICLVPLSIIVAAIGEGERE